MADLTNLDLLSLDDVARAVGSDPDVVRDWHRLGLLQGDGDRFPPLDLERCRLILYAERRGVGAEDIAEACRVQGDLLGQFAEVVAGPSARRSHPLADAADATGLRRETLQRVWLASGLGDQDDPYDDDDLDALRRVKAALDAGLPEDAIVQLLRVFTDALGRVADAESRLFHYHVHERLRAEGLVGQDLSSATFAASDAMLRLVEPTVLYFHRKGFQRALRDDFLLHLTEASTRPDRIAGELTTTILFVDLAGFSPLADAMGDVAAAAVIDVFSDLVRAAANRHDGRVVKQIGDEFMLTFSAPADAIGFGLTVEDSVSAQSQFPDIRIGAHHGSVLYREGDYVGTTVNIAARVTAAAARHEFLITDALRRGANLTPEVEITSVGRRVLKGISDEVDLHRVHHAPRPGRVVDPVCHMLIDDGTAGAIVEWHGREIQFCSTNCARRFQADPDKYTIGVRTSGSP